MLNRLLQKTSKLIINQIAYISCKLAHSKRLDYILLYNGFMNNLKETNIRKAIWHIRRHLNELLNSQDEKYRKHEMFHIKSSIDCLERVMNNEKPYPPMDREEVF